MAGGYGPPVESRGGTEFAELLAASRLVQDRIAGTAASVDVLTAAAARLRETAELLAQNEAADGEQHAGYRLDLPGRGHPLLAPFQVDSLTDDRVEGRVTLTRAHLSGGGRAHAGAVALLFGEVLGVLSVMGGRLPARNASLHVNYRKATPIDRELHVLGRVTGVDGRKIHVVGALTDGDTVVADAEGLYIKVAPDIKVAPAG
jgi:acyl-coenzyme A thioesterase PaaI-like protein